MPERTHQKNQPYNQDCNAKILIFYCNAYDDF